METNFKKIADLLAQSNVPEADQQLFLESCAGVVDGNLELLADLFTESPEWIERTVENFKEKRGAAHERNVQKWKEIIDAEVSLLEDTDRLMKLRSNLNRAIF